MHNIAKGESMRDTSHRQSAKEQIGAEKLIDTAAELSLSSTPARAHTE
jgi:hypothetical protein